MMPGFWTLRCGIWVLLSIIITACCDALQILPPVEHADRASVKSRGCSLGRHKYNDPEWAQSWYGELPEHLRQSEMDKGFSYTRAMAKVELEYALNKIQRNIQNTDQKKQVIGDLGCGGGYVAKELAMIPDWHVIAVDQAKETLKVAKQAISEAGSKLSFSPQVDFIHANITRLPLEEGSLTAVLLFNVLEETTALRAVLREVHRVLRQDGIFIFSTRNRSVRAWLNLLWHTELLRDVSKDLHDWRLGVKPVEMKRIANEEHFNIVHEELQGICEVGKWEFTWNRWPWVFHQKDVVFRECNDDTHFLGWAYKQPLPEGSAADIRSLAAGDQESNDYTVVYKDSDEGDGPQGNPLPNVEL